MSDYVLLTLHNIFRQIYFVIKKINTVLIYLNHVLFLYPGFV